MELGGDACLDTHSEMRSLTEEWLISTDWIQNAAAAHIDPKAPPFAPPTQIHRRHQLRN